MGHQPYFYGPPRFDVGLKPILLAQWLVPDDQAHWLEGKNGLIDTIPHDVCKDQPKSCLAQVEMANLIAGTCGQSLADDVRPILAASRLVSDDLVIMEHADGEWITTACCLCSPTFFSAGHAIGKSLALLHSPVPDGDFGLARRIGRVFTNLANDTILERHNWTVQWSDARYTPEATHLHEAAATAPLGMGKSNLFLRVERQTIRRLPKTGAIIFTIRIRLTPLAELLSDKRHFEAFKQAWYQAPQNVRDYKHWAVLERHVAALLQN